jgi:glycosyltransferase involved in cell wall biosynthesis/cellulose synthase/poly-beta-1,6-N-acetylglucosamine synthase-like glycosyltransferase
MSALALVFWLCVLGVVYAYAGYPLTVWALASLFGRSRENPAAAQIDDAHAPFVSVLIAAHNEEDVIADRLANALALDHPADRLEIIVASDGSTDHTVEVAREIRDPRVRVIDFARRRGKAAVLNEVIPSLAGEVVILSDANTVMASSAVRRFVQWFRDEAIGVVVGRLVLTDPATGRNVDSLYWRYETFLKQMDARLNALLGANGAIYALRRRLFVPIPEDTLVDDLVLPLLVRLRAGRDLVYDRSIIAHEETPADIRCEFTRRSRIGAGGFQSLAVLWPLLSPSRGWIAFTFLSHKVLRWICPFLLLGALAGNALLLDDGLYRLTFAAQSVLYAAAVAGGIAPGRGRAIRALRLAAMFMSMNAALLTGFWRWAAGVSGGTWIRTTRAIAQPTGRLARRSAGVGAGIGAGVGDGPIRVVHLVIALEIGGLEMVVANLARQISRRFQLHVICLEGLGPVAARFAPADVSIECIGDRHTSIAQSVLRLRRRLSALRPDVIHTHNEKAHIRGMLATLGWWSAPALVHTRHGRSRVAGWMATLANRLAILRSRCVVSVSEDAAAILREEGTRPARIRVIRNGIDLNRGRGLGLGPDEAPTPHAMPRPRRRAVAVGRLTPVKDVNTMLRAARLVADAHADFHLDIVGDGPSRAELEAFRRFLNLESHVTFHGAADDVPRFLENATLFVQSSLSEGVSLTLLEAMAAALPIVATRVGGTPEVVEDGITGILVPPRDPETLAIAMLLILNDETLASTMSRAARARVEGAFSVRQMTTSYESLYEDVLARPGVQAGSECRVSL